MSTIFFDDSLAALASIIVEQLGNDTLRRGVVLRDASGFLTFVSPDPAPSERVRTEIAASVADALGAYARMDRPVAFADDPGAARLLNDPDILFVTVGQHQCRVIDRRIVGSAWLGRPRDRATGAPRVVFASIKGGVGRSTALAITASDLADRGRNVLAVDLDLEAPGVGEFLLTEERMPRFGVVDYLVENAIGGIPDKLLESFVGTSALTHGEGGRVDVLPALGSVSRANPGNVMAKISRAMIEDISPAGDRISVSDQISTMIDRISGLSQYDIVLIDSRAGLAELAAPAVLGLGALVLLFGTAQRQTIAGYRTLFAALGLLATRDLAAGRSADWRLLIKPVYAKASLDPQTSGRHREDLYDVFAEELYDSIEGPDVPANSINFPPDDRDAPHSPLMIPFSSHFIDFDPLVHRDHLAKPFYEQTFRPFLDQLDRLISEYLKIPEQPSQ
ncbi:MAG: hypothetical protein WCZ66_10730 [Sphingomonadaceae bacterium]